jgi:autotransporter-associated beta strand protein
VTNGNPSTALNTLMTYDAAGGMRAMRTVPDLLGNPTEFVAALAAADADGKDNVRIASDQTLTGEKTVNALALTYRTGTTAAKLTLDASARLTVGSGLLAFVGGSLDAQAGSVIDVGAREGVIFGNPTVSGCLAGAGGYTFSAFNGTLSLTGTNAYSGQTTVVSGTLHAYRATATPHNDAFPDDGFVLIHPGATLRIGDSTTSDYRTREVIGSLGGGGRVQLGYISDATEEQRRGLVIGAGGMGTPGEVTLDGGTISPGMPGEVGTLSVTTESNTAGAAIPVRLKKGMIEIDIAGPGVCDVLSTLTNVNISAGGGLVVDVDVGSFQPRRGQEWTIIVSESGPITDGNGGKLLDAITDNTDRVNFTAAISEDKTALVLTDIDANPGTVLMVR